MFSALPAPAGGISPTVLTCAVRSLHVASQWATIRSAASRARLAQFRLPTVRKQWQSAGVVFAGIDLRVGEIYDKAQLPQSAVIVMLDGQGTHRPLSRPRSVVWGAISRCAAHPRNAVRRGRRHDRGRGYRRRMRLFAYETLIGARRRGLRRGRSSAGGGVCPIYSQLLWTLGALPAVFALVMVLAWGVGGRLVVSRVRSLVDTVHRLRRRLAARTGGCNDDAELGQLARAFDEMARYAMPAPARTRQSERCARPACDREHRRSLRAHCLRQRQVRRDQPIFARSCSGRTTAS